MKLSVIGKTGQLARALITRGAELGYDITAYDRRACDLCVAEAEISQFIDSLDTDGVIIAAAYTAVDRAEDDYDMAVRVNAAAPKAIADSCAKRALPLIHISTDYVFNGQSQIPYGIDHPTDPINAYGRTKLAGETAVISSGAKAAILRTSWVYDGQGKNFLTTMLRRAQTHEHLNIVADQIGRPTYAGDLADAALKTIRKIASGDESAQGIFHVSGTGAAISWADFATAIFDRAADQLPHKMTVSPIPATAYPTPAQRPAFSVLDTSHFERIVYPLPDWQTGLEQAYDEWERTQLLSPK